jgi:hypothetical protein
MLFCFVCFFFLLFCFVFIGASRGFWFLVRGDRRVLENGRWRCCSKLDLLTSVGSLSTRIFLLRSSALSGLNGHLAGPCSSLLFGAWSAHVGGLPSCPRACGLWLVFSASQGADLDFWRSSVDGGVPRDDVFCTHWFFRLFVSCACIHELLLVLVVNSSLVSQSTGFR